MRLVRKRSALLLACLLVLSVVYIKWNPHYLIRIRRVPIHNIPILTVVIESSDLEFPIPTLPFAELELMLEFELNETPGMKSPTVKESSVKVNGTDRDLHWDDLVSIADDQWQNNFDYRVYNMYPQGVNLSSTIRNLKAGRPIEVVPRSTLCDDEPPTGVQQLLVIYKSNVLDFESRMAIRKIYQDLNLGHGLLFSIGLPRYSGVAVSTHGIAGRRIDEHIKNPRPDWIKLMDEMGQYDDLIVGDFSDTPTNLSLKMFHTFQWVRHACATHRPVLLYMDVDVGFNFAGLNKWLGSLDPGARDELSRGHLLRYNPIRRPGENASQMPLSKLELPWPILGGENYGVINMFGFNKLVDISLAMHFTRSIPVEDVWLAIIRRKLGANCSGLPGTWLMEAGTVPATNCDQLFLTLFHIFKENNCKLY